MVHDSEFVSKVHFSGKYSTIGKFCSSTNVSLENFFYVCGTACHPKITKNRSHLLAHRHRIYAIRSPYDMIEPIKNIFCT